MKRVCNSQFPVRREHGMPHRATRENAKDSQEAKEAEKTWVIAFTAIFSGKNGQDKIRI